MHNAIQRAEPALGLRRLAPDRPHPYERAREQAGNLFGKLVDLTHEVGADAHHVGPRTVESVRITVPAARGDDKPVRSIDAGLRDRCARTNSLAGTTTRYRTQASAPIKAGVSAIWSA